MLIRGGRKLIVITVILSHLKIFFLINEKIINIFVQRFEVGTVVPSKLYDGCLK